MRYLIRLSVVIALLLAFGCADQPAPSGPAMHQAQVPPDVLSQLQNQQPILEKAILDQAETQPIQELWPPTPNDGYAVYAVTFLWGHLLNTQMPPYVTTDWSGTLTVHPDNGVVRVACPIDFERGEDSLIPVMTPSMVQWASLTTGDFDGLSFIIRVPLELTTNAAPPHLRFETAPFSLTLPFRQLDHFIAFYPVNNSQGVAVLARRIKVVGCPGGYIKGEWVKNSFPGNDGHMRGIWYDRFGVPVGLMAGRSWKTESGEGLYEGTLSGMQLTVVIAEFKGHWVYDDPRDCMMCGEGHGRFRGLFKFVNDGKTGLMMGEFGDFMLPPNQLQMPMHGVWKVDCPLSDSDPDGTDN